MSWNACVRIGPLKIVSAVFVPFYPGIDVKIQRAKQSVGFVVVCDLDPLRMRIVIQEQDLLADQCNGGFIDVKRKASTLRPIYSDNLYRIVNLF